LDEFFTLFLDTHTRNENISSAAHSQASVNQAMNIGELTRIVKETTGSYWFAPRRHIRSACRIIEDGEAILSAAPCTYEKLSGLFIVSNARLFFVAGAAFGTIHVKELPPKSVKAISHHYGAFSGSVTLTVGTTPLTITGLPKSGIMFLANAIRQIVNNPKRSGVMNGEISAREADQPEATVRLLKYHRTDPTTSDHYTLVEALDDTG